ncbi:hypothetical protein WJX73_002510 [Symbiochloris irregularis]|uniref:Uncharacterized protein n=1 Tax=Symbiochloris irregularis TaxID=706552 RepID=A0AAW1PR24_9CHLO
MASRKRKSCSGLQPDPAGHDSSSSSSQEAARDYPEALAAAQADIARLNTLLEGERQSLHEERERTRAQTASPAELQQTISGLRAQLQAAEQQQQ